MELSYTQNLEDYHLSLAFAGQQTGTYIDIGGGHPIADNVSFWFYERGWHGIVVEPQPQLAGLYERLRPRDEIVAGHWSGATTARSISMSSTACMDFRPRSRSMPGKRAPMAPTIGRCAFRS